MSTFPRFRALVVFFLVCLALKPANADDSLAKSLLGNDLEARRNAALALREGDNALRRDALAAMIETLMKEKDGQVRLNVLDAIKALGPEAAPAVPALIHTLKTKFGGSGQEESHQDYRSALALAAIGAPAVEGLRGLLIESKENVLAEVVMALGRIGEPAAPAVPDLIPLLIEKRDRIRDEAADALGRIGAPAIAPLIEASKQPDPRMREKAVEALGALSKPDNQVETALLDRAGDDAPLVRASALKSLARLPMSDDTLAPIVNRGLNDPDESVRLAAVRLAAGRDTLLRRMVPVLEPLITHDNPEIARHAIFLLSRTGPTAEPLLLKAARSANSKLELLADGLTGIGRPILDVLIPHLNDADPRIRRTAALAIGPIRPLPEGVERKLAVGLADPDPDVKLATLTAIGALGPKAKGCRPEIRNLLRDGSPEIRVRAIDVLSRSSPRDDQLVADLMTCVGDPVPEVQKRTLEAIRALGPLGRRAIPSAIVGLSSKDLKVREAAAELIAGHGPMAVDAVPALISMLEDPAPQTRVLAANTLGRLGRAAQPAFEPITKLLEPDQKVEARVAAASVLGSLELETDAIHAPITRALGDQATEVRAAAISAIRKIGPSGSIFIPELIGLAGGKNGVERLLRRFERKGPDERSIPALIELLRHENAGVRIQAARFLGLAGKHAETAVPALQRLKEDPSEDVRKQAGAACDLIQGTTAAPKSGDKS